MITMLFTVGSLEDAINASSPFQNSFTNTGSTGVNVALTVILALLIGASNITSLATTSREVWAFARDGGPPGHRWISKASLTHLYSPCHANLSSLTGPPSPECPLQRRPHHLIPFIHPLPHPTRLHRSVQHHNLAQPHRISRHLHDLHRLSPPQAFPVRTFTTRTLQSRSLGSAGQYFRVLLFPAYSRIQLFPRQRAGRRKHRQLGACYMGWRAGNCVGVVFGARQKGLQGPRCLYSGGQEGRDGVADGVRGYTILGAACGCTQCS